MDRKIRANLAKDFGIIAISIIFAVFLVKSGAVREILDLTRSFWFLDSFIAGLFFTSIFTTASAVVAFGEIAQSSQSLLPVVIFGGLGALCGDLIIFRLLKNGIEEDLMRVVQNSKNGRFRAIFERKIFRWLTFFFGALLIASPLPDELGLAMMGLSKTKISLLIPVSFIFNSLGILIIGLVAKNLLGN